MTSFLSPYPQSKPHEVGVEVPFADSNVAQCTYDYIVVGGGTAGCCLASRLSEIPGATVLLIERGPIADTWLNRNPLLSAYFFRRDAPSTIYLAAPIANANNRVIQVVGGEELGGTSRINGCLYMRGFKGDWDSWNRPGWNYEDILPYFVKSENSLNQPESHFRGKNGPWVNQVLPDMPFKILRRVLEAGKRNGIPVVSDINAPDVPSLASVSVDFSIDRNRTRVSTFSAFLPKSLALARKDRLKICTNTLVTRVAVNAGPNGLQANGVYIQAATGSDNVYFARARREVILCGGAIASPQILLLSGIGPRSYLEKMGINVIFDSPGVGSDLMDHYSLPMSYEIPKEDSYHALFSSPLLALIEFLKYLFLSVGLFAYPLMQFSLFFRTSLVRNDGSLDTSSSVEFDSGNQDKVPDMEIMLCPNQVQEYETDPMDWSIGVFTYLSCLIKPRSVGSVRLSSTNPRDRPIVDVNYLSHPDDLSAFRSAARFVEHLAEDVQKSGYPLGNARHPRTTDVSEEEFDNFIRKNVRSAYHYSSTCRMAPLDDLRPGVVDDELRVHGIGGLRVCDTSIFTETLATHTMAPAVVVAEKCADLIKASH